MALPLSYDQDGHICDITGRVVATCLRPSDADQIVVAVNSYHGLLKASKEAMVERVLLRDYFAAHAPIDDEEASAVWATEHHPHVHGVVPRTKLQIIADLRYAYADAMITARSKS